MGASMNDSKKLQLVKDLSNVTESMLKKFRNYNNVAESVESVLKQTAQNMAPLTSDTLVSNVNVNMSDRLGDHRKCGLKNTDNGDKCKQIDSSFMKQCLMIDVDDGENILVAQDTKDVVDQDTIVGILQWVKVTMKTKPCKIKEDYCEMKTIPSTPFQCRVNLV